VQLLDTDDFGFSVGGAVLEDYTRSQDLIAKGYDFEQWSTRRASVEAKLEFGKRINLELELAWDEDEQVFAWRDAYLDFDLPDRWRIAAGKMKQNFGLTGSSSLKNLLTLERPMAGELLNLERAPGVYVEKGFDNALAEVGYFRAENDDGDIINSYIGRFVLSGEGDDYWHTGLSLSSQDYNGSNYRVKSRAETSVLSNFLESEKIKADRVDSWGGDAVWQRDRLSLIGEVNGTRVISPLEGDRHYDGVSAQLSWFLTPDQHRFDDGKFSSFRPAGTHAVELVGSWGMLDAFSKGDGFQANSTSLGVNYYYGRKIKLMGELSWFETTQGEYQGNEGMTMQIRMQYRF
tara:strand:+ start:20296 stop:21336 length:1041 start_codon:yes stop_codon:yes gene_type:complete